MCPVCYSNENTTWVNCFSCGWKRDVEAIEEGYSILNGCSAYEYRFAWLSLGKPKSIRAIKTVFNKVQERRACNQKIVEERLRNRKPQVFIGNIENERN
jgi:hypothetical protein